MAETTSPTSSTPPAAAEIETLLETLAAGPDWIEALLRGVSPAAADTRPSTDEWSAREIVAHLRASDDLLAGRITQALVREGTPFAELDERRWAEVAGYHAMSLGELLRGLRVRRAELVSQLRRLTPDDWTRAGQHELSGPLSVSTLANWIARHEQGHRAQVEAALAAAPAAATDPFQATLAPLERAHALAADWLTSLSTRLVTRVAAPEALAAAFDEPLPEESSDPAAALTDWFQRAEPGLVASPGPRFFGWVNGGSTPAALAGDWLASALDQNMAMWPMSPAGAQTELTVLRWAKDLFGLPAAWAGAVTSGATMSNLVGLAAARQWAAGRLGFDAAADGLGGQPRLTVVSSTELHASARKALGTLGLGRANMRLVPAPGGVVDLDALERELRTVTGPAIIVGNAGEVNTGAFDPLDALAELCHAHPAGGWMHIDGAFGLFAAVSPRYAHLTRGLELADSVTVDNHKWLNVPYDSGFAFVRDADALRGAFASGAAYLAPVPGATWDPMTHVPEMSRRFRALAAWCALRAYGRAGYRELVERCCANAAAFAAWVNATPGLELAAPAPLNIVCFRVTRAGRDADEQDAANRAASAALQADGRVLVSGTVWDGRPAIRAAFDNWATSAQDIVILQDAVREVLLGGA
jgi:glutamate/tyrosine decarboxylase-like PLP-dependent enzyme